MQKYGETWNNRQIGLGVKNEAGQRLTEFCQENTLVTANTPFQQHKRRLYTWTSPDDQYWNQIDYILCSQRWRRSIQSVKTRPAADYHTDHEFLIAKFRLKLKKVRKTIRPFRYDPNQIPYDYTVELMSRFKWLDLVVRVSKDYGWSFIIYKRQWLKISTRKSSGCLRRLYKWWGNNKSKRQWRKGKIYSTEWRVPENSKEK